MLTRLKVEGFKNLLDIDVRFGPFTCIAGDNGVGKSNLFDAIGFLSDLASKPFLDAVANVRDGGSGSTESSALFYRNGDVQRREMRFEAEMIVPPSGEDHLGQTATASITFLRYVVALRLHQAERLNAERLELIEERLSYITRTDAVNQLPFASAAKTWRDSVIVGKRHGGDFISTLIKDGQRVIRLHQDGCRGRTRDSIAASMPRTLLSDVNAAESPTALVAQRELASWQLLQLEPSAIRKPDDFDAPPRVAANGAHMAKALWVRAREQGAYNANTADPRVYAELEHRLSQSLDDVARVRVEVDDKRELLTLKVERPDGSVHTSRSLSDGTLRLLALAVLSTGGEPGLLCLEEPENGIHPQRIAPMLKLLESMVVDINRTVDANNPMRQIVINTHSPGVVANVNTDALLIARLMHIKDAATGCTCKAVRFLPAPGTWRVTADDAAPIQRSTDLLSYRSLPGAKLKTTKSEVRDAGDAVEQQLELKLA